VYSVFRMYNTNMHFGFEEQSLIKTLENDISLDNVSINTKILTSKNLETFNNETLLSKEKNTINRCLKIVFNEEKELICSEFVNIYLLDENRFIPAYGLRRNNTVKGHEKKLTIKSINIVYNVNCINLHFENKPIYYINDVLCYAYEDYCDYEIELKNNNQLLEVNMSEIYKMILPNKPTPNIQIKYSDNKWRLGQLLSDQNFEKDSTGYSYNKELYVQFCIESSKIKDKYLFFNCFGDNVDIFPSNCKKYHSLGQWFFIFDLNDLVIDKDMAILNYQFKTNSEAIVNNCVLINKIEYKTITEYFQGLLVSN